MGALEPLFRTRGNGGVSFVEGASARSGCSEQRSLPCPLSERPKTDAAIFTVQKLFGTFLHKKVQEKKEAASCSQKFWGEQILSVAKNDLVLDSSSVLRPPQNDRGERAPQNNGRCSE